jgi:glycosyltransferase involved in cell wall biosynthesis
MDNSVIVTNAAIKDDSRFVLSTNLNNFGLCRNMYSIIGLTKHVFKPDNDDVAAVVDADDYISKEALATVERVYREHSDTLITHGSYKKISKGRRTKISKPYPRNGDIRKLSWRGSHLKTIKWRIIKQAKPQWFQHGGKWLEAASDLALMFGCIGITGLKKVRHIHKVIYYWNDHVTLRKKRLQRKCEKLLRKS